MTLYSPTLSLSVKQELEVNAYLVLKSVDPQQNRFRVYTISIISSLMKEPVYIVTLSWGRIGSKRKKKGYVCSSQFEVETLLESVLQTRLKHGYKRGFVSSQFPQVPMLAEIPSLDFQQKQLLLFAS